MHGRAQLLMPDSAVQVVEAAADAGADDVEPSHSEDGELHHFRVR